ncbi:MAG TPA: hypothetical protein VF503_12230 [Sphingobium sp.]|uniref:hypothetical protein n=1 Tax=Sphingobium sp. TaxID=1912891 RepID=UPI002ED045B9
MTDTNTVKADATALVAMTLADLAIHLDGVDLPTLQAALAAEQAKGDAARRGAVAALTAAIDGHPELAAAAAADAEKSDQAPVTDDAGARPVILNAQQAADGTYTVQADATAAPVPNAEPALAPTPAAEVPAEPAPSEASAAEPLDNSLAADAAFLGGITTIAQEPLEDAPTDPNAVSAAPARPHDGIIGQFDMLWIEMKNFVSGLHGEVEGELGDVLAFVRSKL